LGGYKNENIRHCSNLGFLDRDNRKLVFFKRLCCARRRDEWARQHLRIDQGKELFKWRMHARREKGEETIKQRPPQLAASFSL
jgi:hypothetical protein